MQLIIGVMAKTNLLGLISNGNIWYLCAIYLLLPPRSEMTVAPTLVRPFDATAATLLLVTT